MNKILWRRVSFLLLVTWLIVIFVFSSMNGKDSTNLSKTILNTITINSIKSYGLYDTMHFILRKLAHLFEYFILSVLAYNYLRFYISKEKRLYMITFIFCLICSCFDEFHQLFTLGRSSKLYDILIDCSATVIFLIIIMYRNNVTKRKSN